MSKADTLLKKATFFERMALYSDRKTFLQSLAQAGGASDSWTMPSGNTDAEIKGVLNAATTAGRQWLEQFGDRIVDAPGGSVLGNQYPKELTGMYTLEQFAKLNKFDNSQLQQINNILNQVAQYGGRNVDKDARMAWYGKPLTAISNAADMMRKTISGGGTRPVAPKEDDSGPAFPGMGLVPMEGHAVPEQEAPKPKPAAPPTINKQDQAAVARLYEDMVAKGDAAPVADTSKMNDGVLGQETRKALDAIKAYYNKTYPTYDPKKGGKPMTDQQAIQAAKSFK